MVFAANHIVGDLGFNKKLYNFRPNLLDIITKCTSMLSKEMSCLLSKACENVPLMINNHFFITCKIPLFVL